MRSFLMSCLWGLATAALLVATPVRAAGARLSSVTPVTTIASASSVTPPASFVFTAPTPSVVADLASETGGGWNEVVCAGCVAAATVTLFLGGIEMLPVLLANPEMIGTFTGVCLMACKSVIQEMLK